MICRESNPPEGAFRRRSREKKFKMAGPENPSYGGKGTGSATTMGKRLFPQSSSSRASLKKGKPL